MRNRSEIRRKQIHAYRANRRRSVDDGNKYNTFIPLATNYGARVSSSDSVNDVFDYPRKKDKKIILPEPLKFAKVYINNFLGTNEQREVVRGEYSEYAKKGFFGRLRTLMRNEANQSNYNMVSTVETNRQRFDDYRATRFNFFNARNLAERDNELENLIEHDTSNLTEPNGEAPSESPGPFSLYVVDSIDEKKRNATDDSNSVFKYDADAIRKLQTASFENDLLAQHLLYDPLFDSSWPTRYTDRSSLRNYANRQGWVIPLKNVCDKVGLKSHFFTDKKVSLEDAREFVLFSRLLRKNEPSSLMLEHEPGTLTSRRLLDFFNRGYDGHLVMQRFTLFIRRISMDKDSVRVHGQYYNNIYLGKRIFGPARKQVFTHSIVGGMERRFEIIDNQVNHIPFTSESSEKYSEHCRNARVRCRDDTRVILKPIGSETINFIHANYVRSPMLFNDFILTQAPMDKTISDFWRMILQEEVRYIFMLISRKDRKRCCQYWPGKVGEFMRVNRLVIKNEHIDDFRDPLFRITTISITEPGVKRLVLEHWQGNMNNSSNLQSPLRLLQLSRNCSAPTVVHDHLGISRAAALIAIELTICNLLRGPSFKFPAQRAVHILRSMRAFAVETPMQYIYIHRVVLHFIRPLVGDPEGLATDYKRWMDQRSTRAFAPDPHSNIPPYRQLSPVIDPDLLPLVRREPRPDFRREIHALVGELPLPVEGDTGTQVVLPIRRHPRGSRY